MGVPFFIKKTGETFAIGIDFSVGKPAGSTLSSGSATSVNRKTGASSTSVILAGGTTCTISDDVASISITSGSSGEWHEVTMTVVLDVGGTIQGVGLLYIE